MHQKDMSSREDSSPVEFVVEDDGSGKAIRTHGLIRDVELKAALRRILGEGGDSSMHELVHAASQRGKNIKKSWWESSFWTFLLSLFSLLSLIIGIFIALKLYFPAAG